MDESDFENFKNDYLEFIKTIQTYKEEKEQEKIFIQNFRETYELIQNEITMKTFSEKNLQ